MRCEHPRPFPIRLRFGRDDTHDRVDSLSPSLILKLTWTLCPPPPLPPLAPSSLYGPQARTPGPSRSHGESESPGPAGTRDQDRHLHLDAGGLAESAWIRQKPPSPTAPRSPPIGTATAGPGHWSLVPHPAPSPSIWAPPLPTHCRRAGPGAIGNVTGSPLPIIMIVAWSLSWLA